MMDRSSVVKWQYVTNKPYSDKDSISGYIEYISKQVEDRRNTTGTFLTNINDNYLGKELKIDESSSVNEIDNYISYIDSRIGSHCLFSDSRADIDDLVQKIKEHDGTLWLPIVSLKESYAKDFHLETEKDWVDKGRELAEVYRKELNIDSDNYGWVAAFHTKSEASQNEYSDAGCQPHLHFILFELEPDPHKRPTIRHKRLETIRDKTASILSREFMKESYKERNDLENSIKSKSKDLSDMSDDIHKLIYDIYSLTHGKGKLSVGEFEHAADTLINMYDKAMSNAPLNNSERYYKEILGINTIEDIRRASRLSNSILDDLDNITDKILAKEDTQILVEKYIEVSTSMRSAKGYDVAYSNATDDMDAIKREIKNSILKLSKDLNYSNRFISKKFKGMLIDRIEIGSIKQNLSTYEVINTTKVITTLLKEAGIKKDAAKEYLNKVFDTYNDEKRKKMAMLEFNRVYKKLEVAMDVTSSDFWDTMRNIDVPYNFPSIYEPIIDDTSLSNSLILEPITRLSIKALDEQKNVLDLNYAQTLLSQSLNSLSYIPKTKEEYEEKYDLLCDTYSSYLESERSHIYENEI